MSQPTQIFTMDGISKRYGGVTALERADLVVNSARIHAILGENGAGKSTLIKIMSGVVTPDTGRMVLDGKDVSFASPSAANDAGIVCIFQELSLIPDLSVADNIVISHPPTRFGMIDRRAQRRIAEEALARAGAEDIHPMALIFAVLKRLRSEGLALLYISHRMHEIAELADECTVFRNGRRVVTEEAANLTKDDVIAHMIGRGSADMHMGEVADLKSSDAHPIVLKAEGLSDGAGMRNVSITLRKGEITGVYGFMGCGQIELARALFGKVPRKSGRITLEGKPVHFRSTAAARAAGIAYVPENRRMMLFRSEPVFKNVSIATLHKIHRLLLKPKFERGIAAEQIRDLQIRRLTSDLETAAACSWPPERFEVDGAPAWFGPG
eukprot:gene20445-21071_t